MEMTRIYRDGERCRMYLRADQIVRIEPNRNQDCDAQSWILDNCGRSYLIVEPTDYLIQARRDEEASLDMACHGLVSSGTEG